MFYNVDCLKKGGRFYLCWLADSWPLRFEQLTQRSNRLLFQDIRKTCDELMEFMSSESGRPTKRFSLRLSSQLMRGLARLYRKKTDLFVRDVWKINYSFINRHKSPEESREEDEDERPLVQRRRSVTVRDQRRRLIFEEVPEEEHNVEQRIRTANNTVAREEDITLREPIPPEIQMIQDGFGEMNLNPVEVMLAIDDAPMQTSVLVQPQDQSADKSRVNIHETLQMERISELDLTLFRKSAGEPSTLMDIEREREILEISEIPQPVPPVPAPETQMEVRLEEPREEPRQQQVTTEQKKPEEFVLEDVEEIPPPKRRRINRKLKIDKNIKICSALFRERIQDKNVELRAEFGSTEASLLVPPALLLTRPAALGGRISHLGSKISSALLAQFADRIADADRPPADRDVEMPLIQRDTEPVPAPVEPQIQEVTERTIPEPELPVLALQDISNIDISARNMHDVTAQQAELAELLTQKVMTVSQEKRASELEKETTRQQRRQASLEAAIAEANKENIPGGGNVSAMENMLDVPRIELPEVTEQPTETAIRSMLHETGLDDEQRRPAPVLVAPEAAQRRQASEGSETPLGSLDRTKVSLGCEEPTNAQLFINKEWGTQGTMIKIFRCVAVRRGPITVHSLVERGPVLEGHTRVIAARCFASILKLKSHGFINVDKDENCDIKDIEFGPRLRRRFIPYVL
ncbi:uncharacterized protein LOC112044588 [Bicyclus anynana]|uniref:Uncharacterized protein LOC112044588 n=1 Tax=Bicyclus anynana TaxID=110368 RepID=A0ABM3LKE5_BICAN|nr:uncharacterized protein LOC112044588 [Bicyclus anynana]